VIDGQQRFTTLTILALAIIKTIEELIERGEEPEANNERAQYFRRLVLGEKDPTSLTAVGRLTLSKGDDEFFHDYLLQFSRPPVLRRLPESNQRLLETYDYFKEEIGKEFAAALTGETLSRFLNETVARRLQFIVITVEDDSNAYLLFETLNARGVGLSPADLIKNYLYSLVATSEADLERMDRLWRRVTGTTSQERFPEFLRFHLTCIHGRVRRERLFRTIRDQVRDSRSAFKLLVDIEQTAELFAALRDSTHDLWRSNQEDRRRIRALTIFGVTQIFPVLFAAFERFSRQDFSRVLKLAETLSFRYQIIGRLETSILESVYAETARKVYSGEIKSPSVLFRALSRIYVTDDQFRADIDNFSVQTSGRGKKLARYILFELERDASHAQIDMDSDQATIEHIFPENPTEDWVQAFSPRQAEISTYRIGNLTLLEPGLNRDAANRPYRDKLTLYARSGYSLTRGIVVEEWSPEAIAARQSSLADRAVHIWRSDFD
jgi:hypothetical protein